MTSDTDVTSDDVHRRILDAAQLCFYRDGIVSTGVDTLATEAGVSKRTLYNHFGSKDGLVMAYIEERDRRWRRLLAADLDQAGGDTMERLLAYVRGYGWILEGDDFRGSAFINAAAELADSDHPALAAIRASLANVERGLRQILLDAGVPHPGRLAAQILLVLEGAVSVGGVRRSREAFRVAESVVVDLVGPHLAADGVTA